MTAKPQRIKVLGVIRDEADDEVIVLGAQADMYDGASTRSASRELAGV